MKRITAIFLVLVVALGTVISYAATMTSRRDLTLSFSGTTAQCDLTITESGKTIDATMELWRGSTKLATWSKSKKTTVSIDETYNATSGVSYTLKAYGTINGVSFSMTSVTKTCP